jgi:D-alanyl-D-alanine carboxypeptidase (penicillin-binding protein 5/6)
MGAESRDIRNAEAQKLLDWGFSSYGLFTSEGGILDPIRVTGGTADRAAISYPKFTAVLPKSDLGAVEHTVTLPESIQAPIRMGETVGKVTYTCKGQPLGEIPITATETVERLSFWELWRRLLRGMVGLSE